MTALPTSRLGSKGERTAARILDVALEQFSRLGFERVTLGGIAAEAGISQASLHYHFTDKADLWRSAMLQLREVIEQEERLLGAAVDASPLGQLRMAMRLFIRISWDHPALGRIVMLEGMAGGERLEWLENILLGPRNKRLARLVAAAIAAGELRPLPPGQIVVALQAAGASPLNLAPLMQLSFGIDATSSQTREMQETMIVDAFLAGLTLPAQPKIKTGRVT